VCVRDERVVKYNNSRNVTPSPPLTAAVYRTLGGGGSFRTRVSTLRRHPDVCCVALSRNDTGWVWAREALIRLAQVR